MVKNGEKWIRQKIINKNDFLNPMVIVDGKSKNYHFGFKSNPKLIWANYELIPKPESFRAFLRDSLTLSRPFKVTNRRVCGQLTHTPWSLSLTSSPRSEKPVPVSRFQRWTNIFPIFKAVKKNTRRFRVCIH